MKKIGDIAKEFGVSQRTIRFYEEKGILKPDNYTTSGYRLYSEENVKRLKVVLLLRKIGFSISEIKSFLNIDLYGKTPEENLELLIQILKKKLKDTAEKIEALKLLKNDIEGALDHLENCSCRFLPNWEECALCKEMIENNSMPEVLLAILKNNKR